MAIVTDADADAYNRTTSLPAGNAVTMAAFFFFNTDRNASSGVFSLDDNDTGAGSADYLYLETTADGTSLQAFGQRAATFTNTATIVTLSPGNWYFGALTHDGSTLRGYAGLLTAASLSTQSVAFAQTPTGLTNLRIGRTSFTSEFLNGRIAGFKVWDAVLSAADLEMERRQLVPVRFANLNTFAPLVGPDATTAVVDYGPNKANFTSGTATFGDNPPVPWKMGRKRVVLPAAASGVSATPGVGAMTLAGAVAALRFGIGMPAEIN